MQSFPVRNESHHSFRLPGAWCWEGWSRFWFTPADPTPLAIIRILTGALLVYIHLAYTADLYTFFGEHAWVDAALMQELRTEAPYLSDPVTWNPAAELKANEKANEDKQEYSKKDIEAYEKKWHVDPRQAYAKGQWLWSIWFHVTDPTGMWLTHATIILIMLLFTVGFFTRVTGVLTWAAMLSYLSRAPTALFGMDTIMTIVTSYLVLAPAGAALSIDRLIARWRLRRHAARFGLPMPELPPPRPSVSANVALRLMQIHLSIVYLISGLSKLEGATWWSGVAVWRTVAHWEFSPMRSPLYMDIIKAIGKNKWVCEIFLFLGTYFTLVFEISFAFLIWLPRTRWLMVMAAACLHLGIALCMGLVTFSMMMLILLLSFVPASVFRDILRPLLPRREID